MEKIGGPTKTGKSGGTGKNTGQTKTDRANDRAMQTKIASHKNTNTGQTAKQGEASRTQINHSPKDAKVAQSGSKTPLADHLITQKKSDQTKSDQATGENSAKAGVQNQMSDQQALETVQRHSNREKTQEVAQVQIQAQTQGQVQAASGQEQQAQAMPQPQPNPHHGEHQVPRPTFPHNQPGQGSPWSQVPPGAEGEPRSNIRESFVDTFTQRAGIALGATAALASVFLVGMTKPAGAETTKTHHFDSGGKLDVASSASRQKVTYTGKDQATYNVGTKFDFDTNVHTFSQVEQKQPNGDFKTLEPQNWPQDLKDYQGFEHFNKPIQMIPRQATDPDQKPDPQPKINSQPEAQPSNKPEEQDCKETAKTSAIATPPNPADVQRLVSEHSHDKTSPPLTMDAANSIIAQTHPAGTNMHIPGRNGEGPDIYYNYPPEECDKNGDPKKAETVQVKSVKNFHGFRRGISDELIKEPDKQSRIIAFQVPFSQLEAKDLPIENWLARYWGNWKKDEPTTWAQKAAQHAHREVLVVDETGKTLYRAPVFDPTKVK